MAADSQRTRERRELEERVSVRRALLGQKMEEESSQFRQERQVLFLSIFLLVSVSGDARAMSSSCVPSLLCPFDVGSAS